MSPQQQINEIDRKINALRKARPVLNDRFAEETELFRQRGVAQLARDEADARAIAGHRIKPLRKCPTCGHRTLAAA